jgi:small membrane protein
MILKLFLIIAITSFGIWLLKTRKSARVKAWQKLIVVVFVIGVITVTLSPQVSLQIALFFGLNRATDLIVYATIILLLFVTANIYLKFQDLHNQLVRIGRAQAIQEGLRNNQIWEKGA